jgi:hypothetical protein
MSNDPVEITTRYATSVDSLVDAWHFIMEHLDEVGPDPQVEICPIWTYDVSDDLDLPRRFTVVVSGMVEEKKHVST